MEGLEKGVRTLCEVDKMPCHTNGPADGTVCRIKVYHLFSSPASDDIERRNNRFPRVGNQNKVGIKLFTCYSFPHFPFCIGDCACSLGLKTVTNPMIIYFKNVFCLCVCPFNMPSARGEQKRVSDPPGLELQMIVSHSVGAVN